MPKNPNPLPRLLERLDLDGDCLVFTGHRDRQGYGKIKTQNKPYLAHRLMWELMNGPVPEGMMILHSCDNPPCVLPAHLRVGTAKDNSDDMVSRGRHHNKGKVGKCLKGHQKIYTKNGKQTWCPECRKEKK